MANPSSSNLNVIKATIGGIDILTGSGAPTMSAPKGSLYINTAATTTTTRLYINTNGTTGWTNFTTAA